MNRIDKYSIAFPARDAFYHGLSREFYDEFSEFKNVFDSASEFMKENLYEVAYENTKVKSELHTACLITHCMALYRLLLLHIKKPHAAIGFSQGEFAAVSAVGAASFPEILKLVYELELLLINDRDIKNGSMVRVMELDREKLRECCQVVDPEGENIALSITYSQDQNVVSGRTEKIKELSILAKEKGARWIIPLDGGAFHSPLCKGAMKKARPIFDKYQFQDAEYGVFSCLDGEMATDGDAIKNKLSKQIAMPIAWDTLIKNQKAYGNKFILELGTGCTISGNTRIVDDTITCKWINDLSDFKALIKLLK